MKCNLYQADDDSWTLVRHYESGIVAPGIPMGKLSKQQVSDQAHRWGYTHVVIWDKAVIGAIRSKRR
jgi:hypothetical protein